MSKLKVRKGRSETVTVSLGFDASGEIFTSQIRAEPSQTSLLIAEWEVTFLTDGTDGELVLKLEDVITAQIAATSGYMDIMRMSAGEALPVFDEPLEVFFQGTVTA